MNLGILKFLAFEQVLKNSLTTLPMGGGKRNPHLAEAMGRFAREHVEAHYKLSDEASAYADFLRKVAEARRRGELQAPPPYEQADLAAAIAASIADMPLGRMFGLDHLREALFDATGHQT